MFSLRYIGVPKISVCMGQRLGVGMLLFIGDLAYCSTEKMQAVRREFSQVPILPFAHRPERSLCTMLSSLPELSPLRFHPGHCTLAPVACAGGGQCRCRPSPPHPFTGSSPPAERWQHPGGACDPQRSMALSPATQPLCPLHQ